MAACGALAAMLGAHAANAQEIDVGHKLPGVLGLQAGTQHDAGVYAAIRLFGYSANEVIDRNGHALPVGLRLRAISGVLGIDATFEVQALSTYVGASVAMPAAHVTGQTQRPETSLDREGLSDLSVQPIQLGWRLPHLDIVTGYAFYAPTGDYEPGGSDGVGHGQWSHEFSLGETIYFDTE